MKRYSQNMEQDFITDYFAGYVGKFIDIGAFDVFRFSNTRALYEAGWSGIMVEPAPKNFKGLHDHYKDEKRIELFNYAIGVDTGEIDFYESDGDAVGTTDIKHMEKWGSAGVKYEKIVVKQVAVDMFMRAYGEGCDFLSIDTEATNIQLFRAIPLYVWETLKMLCIEHDENQGEIQQRLEPYGFKTLHINAENIILAK